MAEPETCETLDKVRDGYLHHVIVLPFRSYFGCKWKMTQLVHDGVQGVIGASPSVIMTGLACAVGKRVFEGDMSGGPWILKDEVRT